MSIRSRIKAIPEAVRSYFYDRFLPAWYSSGQPLVIMVGYSCAALVLIETTFLIWLASAGFPFRELPVLPSWASWLINLGGVLLAFRCLDKAYDV